ncbi:protein of unknown function [Ruminococcaceae bacterium BL-6]|nr:protein of unknown function [Ruminococcaceae bacterium BL-6]
MLPSMMQLEYDDAARICLTHSFPIQDISTYIGNFDVSEEEVNAMNGKLKKIDYDDYDRLIQLCDCLAMPEGVVSLSERMDDIARRYGRYPDRKRKANLKLKEYFENRLHRNIYEITTDNRELWGL